jgi:hypothetical protein
MTEDEIKAKISEQVQNGLRILLRPSTAPGRASEVVARLTMCMIPLHSCAACGDDRPVFEFKRFESNICLHDRCCRLWMELERAHIRALS